MSISYIPCPHIGDSGRDSRTPNAKRQTPNAKHLFRRVPVLPVVRGEEVQAPVAFEVAPDGVDVVGVVLRVVVLDQEARTLDPVVVALTLLDAAHPGELNLVQPGLADGGE